MMLPASQILVPLLLQDFDINWKPQASQQEKSSKRVKLREFKDHIPRDGHDWLKYGQKDIAGGRLSRHYFRCRHPNSITRCPARRVVDVHKDFGQPGFSNLPLPRVTYTGKHNHGQPATPSPSLPPARLEIELPPKSVAPAKDKNPLRPFESPVDGKSSSGPFGSLPSCKISPKLPALPAKGAIPSAVSLSPAKGSLAVHPSGHQFKSEEGPVKEQPCGLESPNGICCSLLPFLVIPSCSGGGKATKAEEDIAAAVASASSSSCDDFSPLTPPIPSSPLPLAPMTVGLGEGKRKWGLDEEVWQHRSTGTGAEAAAEEGLTIKPAEAMTGVSCEGVLSLAGMHLHGVHGDTATDYVADQRARSPCNHVGHAGLGELGADWASASNVFATPDLGPLQAAPVEALSITASFSAETESAESAGSAKPACFLGGLEASMPSLLSPLLQSENTPPRCTSPCTLPRQVPAPMNLTAQCADVSAGSMEHFCDPVLPVVASGGSHRGGDKRSGDGGSWVIAEDEAGAIQFLCDPVRPVATSDGVGRKGGDQGGGSWVIAEDGAGAIQVVLAGELQRRQEQQACSSRLNENYSSGFKVIDQHVSELLEFLFPAGGERAAADGWLGEMGLGLMRCDSKWGEILSAEHLASACGLDGVAGIQSRCAPLVISEDAFGMLQVGSGSW